MTQPAGLQPRQPALDEREGAELYAMLDAALAHEAAIQPAYRAFLAEPTPAHRQAWLAAENGYAVGEFELAKALAASGNPVLRRGDRRYWRRNGTYEIRVEEA